MSGAGPRKSIDWTYVRFLAFKWTVYGLLAFNVYLLLKLATVYEALDSVGWLLLIAVMEYKTTTLDQQYSLRQKLMVGVLRIAAYLLIIHAWTQYYRGGEWMDFANSTVWLLVCVSLEYDVYAPCLANSTEWRVRNAIKIPLYACLLGMAVLWGIQGAVLDFYDAVLWIVCFAVIELNVFQFEQPSRDNLPPASAPASGSGTG